jgi:hypothetical protein
VKEIEDKKTTNVGRKAGREERNIRSWPRTDEGKKLAS